MADINRLELFGRFSADVEIRPGPSSRELTVTLIKNRTPGHQTFNGITASRISTDSPGY
jgi:hypothetical protein